MKLFRTRNVRAESIDGSLKEKLNRLLSRPKLFVGGIAIAAVIKLFNPTPAMAAENQMSDTTNQVTTEQVVTNDMNVNDVIANAVEQAQTVAEPSAPIVETATQEVTTPTINEDINSRVPEVATTTENTQTTTDEAQTATDEVTTPTVNEDINNRVPEVDTTTENTQTTTDEVQTVTDEVTTPTVNEDINNRVPEVDTTTENTQTTTDEAQTATDETEPTVSDDETNTDEVTPPTTENDQTALENSGNGYQMFEQDGQIYIVGDVSEEQLSQIVNDYGSVNVFDQETINSGIVAGETVNLGESGYTATKDENGNVTINDANGNVIASWTAQIENVQDNQQENQQNNDNVSDFEVDSNEYLLIKNEDGSYTIAQGGVGLSGQQLQDLIDELKQNGKLPEDAIVNSDVLPQAPTDEMIQNGQTEQSAIIGDYVFSTTDGQNYTVKDKD